MAPRQGRAAIGLKAVRPAAVRAGGPTGRAFVYSTRTGRPVADFQLAPTGQNPFVNDVAVTRAAACFTDSRRGALYVLPRDLSGPRELPLPDMPLLEGNNLNGIVATADGDTLIAVQGNAGVLWRIDARTGRATDRPRRRGGDERRWPALRGRTLYVVRNRVNRIAVVRLGADLSSGRVTRTITSRRFDVPTTIAALRGSLYAVNARFGTDATPQTEYWVTRVRR